MQRETWGVEKTFLGVCPTTKARCLGYYNNKVMRQTHNCELYRRLRLTVKDHLYYLDLDPLGLASGSGEA